MIRIIVGVFLILHGLVHLLYFGQSRRIFELQPGMVWPDGSWAFARFFGNESTRLLASVFLVAVAIGFVAGGVGVLLGQAWWQPVVVGAAAFSSILYILFWDGAWPHLHDKGAIGILINLVILAAVLVFQWPNFEF
jgi:hypothetical protein